MARYCSATSLVALALLGCLFLTGIGAQQWPQQPQGPPVAPPPQFPGYPPQPPVLPPQRPYTPPQPPQVFPPPQVPKIHPQPPQVFPPPQVPKIYPQPPQVFPPPQVPKIPPQPPQVLPPPQRPKIPPQPPQVLPPPQRPKIPPQPPQVLPPPQRPKIPPQPPQVLPPPQRPKIPPQTPQVLQPPQRPKIPPQPPQVLPPPQRPKVPPQPPQVLPPPQRPKVPPLTPQVLQPPQRPKNPPQPGYNPKWPPQVLPPQPPQPPQWPKNTPQAVPVAPGSAWSGYAPVAAPAPAAYPFPAGHSVYPGTSPTNPNPPYTPGKKFQPRAYPDKQSPQEPQVSPPKQPRDGPQNVSPPIFPPVPPPLPPFETCEVDDSQKVPCGHSAISAAECEAISCCYDGRRCYFGKAVTVQCTKDAYFIVVVAKDATLPHIDLDTISLLGQGQGCAHVDSNSGFAIYHFPVTACGSIVSEEPGVIVYENSMMSSYEIEAGPYGVITRDSSFELLFQCRYTGVSVEAVTIETLPLDNPPLPVAALGPLNVYLRLANGQCAVKGCDEEEAAYFSYYTDADYPVTKVLRDPVYVEVLLLGKTDPNLYLTLGRCWTTTTANPHSLPQWDILIDGCPNTGDRYTSSLIPVTYASGLEFPSHYRRFSFKMFTFVDQLGLPRNEQVYLHCSTAVCYPSPGGTCEPSCHRKSKRDVTTVVQKKEDKKIVVSVGPVIMTRE